MLKELYQYLNGQGGYPVYRRRAPNGEPFPYAILDLLNDSPIDVGLSELGARAATVTVDCYAWSDGEAERMEEAFREALDRPAANYTLGGYQVLSSAVTGMNDLSDLEDPDNAGEKEVVRYQLEVEIHYQ